MNFRTEVNTSPLPQRIVYGDGMLFLGSCFADEVGKICKGLGFNAMINPFGVLYNPVSISNAIHRLDHALPFSKKEVIPVGKEYYCTFSHNTEFWNPSEEDLLSKVNKALEEAHHHFVTAKWIVISLGTAWVYRYLKTQETVGNCHKLPSQLFDRYCLTVSASETCLSTVVKAHPEKQFVFVVSPLRHLKDGLHGNQLSKATLLLAVHRVCEPYNNAHYFPAYEILLDELRDYRFYKEDMTHPTEQAVRYIWEKFAEFAIDPQEAPLMKEAQELRQMLHHRPLFPGSESFQQFVTQREQKLQQFAERYPQVQLDNLKS